MPLELVHHSGKSYQVDTVVFSGPLDLLLQLVERAELDITKVSLAIVTDQYLSHLSTLQDRPAEEVSEFLIIASKLIQIKSETLLPRPVLREEGEIDPGQSLADQLWIYRQFKNVASILTDHEASGKKTYLRLSSTPKIQSHLEMGSLSLEDLLNALLGINWIKNNQSDIANSVSIPTITIRDQISLITNVVKQIGQSNFITLLSQKPSRLEVVITFLAVLELIKRYMIKVSQDNLFGEIQIQRDNLFVEDSSFELEFGE